MTGSVPATVSGPGAKRPSRRAESRETAKTMSVMGRNATPARKRAEAEDVLQELGQEAAEDQAQVAWTAQRR
jgi:hypothetical protein